MELDTTTLIKKHIMRIKKSLINDKHNMIIILEPNPYIRKCIHYYTSTLNNIISRTLYMSHGAEKKCCNTWHKSSAYGKSWNGGSIYCDNCDNISFFDFDDIDDLYECMQPRGDMRLSDYKPTDEILICRSGYSYKKWNGHPFSYRKHYKAGAFEQEVIDQVNIITHQIE